MSSESAPILHYGALITLSAEKNKFLYSEGFIDNRVTLDDVRNPELNFEGAVFRIIPQCLHSTQAQILKVIERGQERKLKNRLEKLEDALDGETKTNHQTYNKLKGEPIRFGSLVQLEHVQSRRFLTISSESAESEKENLKITLEDYGSEESHFKAEPAYNFQREGGAYVKIGDKLKLEVVVPYMSRVANLHASQSKALGASFIRQATWSVRAPRLFSEPMEVNASLDCRSTWTIDLFTPYNKKNPYVLTCGDYIWLTHTEEEKCLSYGCISTRRVVYLNENLSDTNGLWMIESLNKAAGGLVNIKETYRLKHVSTGRYLYLKKDEFKDKLVFRLKLTRKRCDDERANWSFVPLSGESEFIQSDQVCLLKNAENEVTISGRVDLKSGVYFQTYIEEPNYFKFSRADGQVVLETLFLLHCYPIIKNFPTRYRQLASGLSIDKNNTREFEKLMKLVIKCVNDLELFCKNKLQSMMGLDNQYGEVQRERQRMIREQRFFEAIEVVLEIAEVKKKYLHQVRELKKNREIITELHLLDASYLSELVASIYQLLKTLCNKNRENQYEAMNIVRVFSGHVGLGLGATECILSMLRDNEELMYKISENGIIEHYAELKARNKQNPELIKFFKSICVFKGEGVTINQEKVFDLIRRDLAENDVSLLKEKITRGESKEYLKELLEFFANLCLGRNFVCIEAFKEHFPVGLLSSMIWDQGIDRELRAALTKLLLTIHLDIHPREESKKPELIRVLHSENFVLSEEAVSPNNEGISSKLTSENPIYRKNTVETSSKSENQDKVYWTDKEIDRVLSRTLEFFYLEGDGESDSGELYFDSLSYETLRLADKMLRFELYGTSAKVLKNSLNFKESARMDLVGLLRCVSYFFATQQSSQVPRYSKLKTTSSYEQIQSKKQKRKKNSFLTKLHNDPHNASDPIIRCATNLRNFLQTLKSNSLASHNSKDFGTRIKIKISGMYHFLLNWRQDFLISNFVEFFKAQNLKNLKSSKKFAKLLPEVMEIRHGEEFDSLDRLAEDIYDHRFEKVVKEEIEDMDTIIPEKVVSELFKVFVESSNYKLKSSVFSLILRCFSQRTELLKSLSHLHVITHNKEIELLRWLKENLSQFKQLGEKSELALRYWDQDIQKRRKFKKKFNEIIWILKNLELVLYEETYIVEQKPLVGDSRNISKSRQQMLYFLEAHDLITKLIKDGMHTLKELCSDSNKEAEASKLKQLFTLCHKILRKFVTRNPKNQKKLEKSVHLFSKYLSIDVGQIPLICEIYRENMQLVLNVNPEILYSVKTLIESKGRDPMFLELFDTIQVCNETPIQQVQIMVLNLFIGEHPNKVLLYLNEDLDFDFEKTLERDKPVAYHRKLVKVLAKSGYGKLGMYLNEAKCQKIFPINKIIEILFEAEEGQSELHSLKIPVLDFFQHIYLECEKFNEEVRESEKFLEYINFQAHKLRASEEINQHMIEFLRVWVKTLRLYCHESKNMSKQKEDYEAIKNYVEALTESGRLFSEGIIPSKLLSDIQALCNYFDYDFLFSGNVSDAEEDELDPLAPPSLFKGTSVYGFYEESGCEMFKNWKKVKNELVHDEGIKHLLKLEDKALRVAVYNVHRMDESISFEKVAKALVEFIRLGRNQTRNEMTLKAIEFLAALIAEPVCEKMEEPEKVKLEVQEKLNSYDAGRVSLTLLCDSSVDMSVFKALMKLSVQLLDNGNQKVQQEFYQFFINVPYSEVFFERVHNLFKEHTKKVSNNPPVAKKKAPVYKKKESKIKTVLRLLQLLCENHNDLLQNYIRHQHKSRTNYNMIHDIINLLENLVQKKYARTFLEISQCLDTLTEFVQGPCMKNQESIIDSQFLEIATGILSLNERAEEIEIYDSLKEDYQRGTPSELTGEYGGVEVLSGWMIAHLKYKCMITLLSLLEGRKDSFAITRLIRALNIEVLKENLVSMFTSYTEFYGGDFYDKEVFNHFLDNENYDFHSAENNQDLNPKYYQTIIEVGFMIYHLMKYFNDSDEPENKEIIENELFELQAKVEDESSFPGSKLLGGLSRIGMAFLKSGISTVSRLAGRQTSQKFQERQKTLELAYDFFERNTGNIEVVFMENLTKIYFYLPPEVKGLSEEIKEQFHLEVDRSSDQSKLKSLVDSAELTIEKMQHEHSLKKFFDRNKVISAIASNVSLWRELAFLMTLCLNFILIFSYSRYNTDRKDEPSLFYYESSDSDYGLSKKSTETLIMSLGFVQTVSCLMIVMFFFMKVGPLLARRGWLAKEPSSEFWRAEPRWTKILWKRALQAISAFLTLLSNFEVIYYSAYMAFSVMGTFGNHLFFSLLLLDIINRYPSLQNVIKSIVKPKKQLLLTFLLTLIFVYLFGIIGYLFLEDFFGNDCDSLFKCTITIWDQGFKNDGGIGGYLGDWGNSTDWLRLTYDNLFNIVILIIMMSIVAGNIIDTFAVLREELEANTKDRETKCYICGLNRDYIERKTSRSFRFHTLKEHNEWNYILFIAYLLNKDETEYSGVESYIREKYDEHDVSWFPQHNALSIQDQDKSQETKLIDAIRSLESRVSLLEKHIVN